MATLTSLRFCLVGNGTSVSSKALSQHAAFMTEVKLGGRGGGRLCIFNRLSERYSHLSYVPGTVGKETI